MSTGMTHSIGNLKQHIKDLPKEEREHLWEWFDGDPDAIHDLIEAAAEGLEGIDNEPCEVENDEYPFNIEP